MKREARQRSSLCLVRIIEDHFHLLVHAQKSFICRHQRNVQVGSGRGDHRIGKFTAVFFPQLDRQVFDALVQRFNGPRLEEQIDVAAEIEEGLHALHVARAISVTVVHDAEIALEAAFGGSSGAIMIAGTGSVVYGRRADGGTVRIGGWGYLLGDEGSGYRLGKLALAAVCRAYEGGEDTTLTDSIASAFGACSVDEVISLVYGGGIRLPDLAPHVTECAVTGDGVAFSILRQETEALAEQLERMATANPDIEPQYSLFGGLAAVNLYAHNLRSAVRRRLPHWHYVATDALPVAGAVRLAFATLLHTAIMTDAATTLRNPFQAAALILPG